MPDRKLELIIEELGRLAWSWELRARVSQNPIVRQIYTLHASRLCDIIARYTPREEDSAITREDTPDDLTTKNMLKMENNGKNRKKITCSKKSS